jgi:hypothetical protein
MSGLPARTKPLARRTLRVPCAGLRLRFECLRSDSLSLMIGVRDSHGSSGAKAQVKGPAIKENAIEIP